MDSRFFSKVEPELNSGCWLWSAGAASGYGVYHVAGRPIKAHRYSWELHNGRIPGRLWVLHKCDTPACVNPAHLYLGTVRENVADMMRRGRHGALHGDASPLAKLTAEDVQEVRRLRLSGQATTAALAKRFGVGKACIRQVTVGLRFARLPGAGRPARHSFIGEANPAAKITAEIAAYIRASTEKAPAIGRRFGISKQTVSAIRRGEIWSSAPSRAAITAATGEQA